MVKHRVGIIGLGIMGRRMVVNFNNHPLFEIVGVWDPSEQSISKPEATIHLFYSLRIQRSSSQMEE